MLAMTVNAYLNKHRESTNSGPVHQPAHCFGADPLPVCSELHFSMLTGDQLWDERQVGDLRGGPAKLEDDDEWGKVDQAGPLRSVRVTAQALVEDEGKGHHHTQRA